MTPEELKMVVDALDERSWRRTRRWIFAGIAALGVLVPGILFATTVSVPNTFTANTPARAAEVNANFAVLAAEATRVSNIVLGPSDAGNQVVGLAPPVNESDAANKAYIDAASASGAGGALILYGTTTCPTGWTIALGGTIFLGVARKVATADPTGVAPPTALECIGSGARVDSNGSLLNYYSTTTAVSLIQNKDPSNATTGTCVICVK